MYSTIAVAVVALDMDNLSLHAFNTVIRACELRLFVDITPSGELESSHKVE